MIAALALRQFAGTAFKSVLGGGTVPVLAVAVFMAATGTAYFKGVEYQKTKCATATLTSTVAAQRRELERLSDKLATVQKMRLAAEQRGVQDAAKIEQWRDETDAFKQSISKRPIGCIVGADDAGRLLKIGN